ncbi:oxygenase [Lithospermum erythrorhizon]|uniref:Oxygenase n=1 Tax=Lithospermum erythrorhizon TaxID=34254 RepID=A0AAV3QPY2_LITER
MTPHFILLCFIPLLVLIFFKNSKLRRKTLDPPGPPGLPLLGNLHQFDANNTHLYVWELSQKYGPIMSLKLGSVPTLVISSAKMAKEVMKTYYDNIFASRPKHLALQKLSYYEFATLAPIREDEVARLAKKISEFASLGKVVDFRKTMMFVSSSFICRVAFGKRYEEGGLESRRFDKILSETQNLMGGFFLSDYIPSLGWVDKIFGMISRLEKNFKELDSFYEELIQEHLNKQNK